MFLHMLASGIGFIIALAFFTALVIIVVRLLKGWRPRRGFSPRAAEAPSAPPVEDPTDSAVRILSERLANGDIDVEDYYARRTALKGPDPHRADPQRPEPGVDI